MRLLDGIIFTLVNTVICVALPKLLSLILTEKQPLSNLSKKSAIASAESNTHILLYDVASEPGVWLDEKDVALASSGVGDSK